LRILFIYPNLGTGEIPLNLSYLTSILKNDGCEVKVFDTSIYSKYSQRGDSQQTSVGQFKKIQIRNDAKIVLKDTDPTRDLLTLVEDFKPELICATSFTHNFKLGLSLLNEVKKQFDIPTIFGGVHTTLVPDSVISEQSVDMICVGEGEEMLLELSRNPGKTDIRNLWIKKDGQVIKNPLRPLVDLNTLPYQDFDGYENYNFFRPLAGKLYKSASVEVSRGCPYKCSYCVNHSFQKLYKGLGSYHRVKSINKAIGNIVHLKNKYGIELIRFWDEDFTTLPLSYLRDFSNEYIDKVHLPFLIYARVDTITQEKVDLLQDMNCITIAMGIESGSPRVREEVLNRNMSDEKIINSFAMVKDAGIRCSAYNMIGLPHETREDIFKTIELNRICKPDSSSIAFLEPYPKTEIFNDCVRSGYIKEDYVATFDFFNPHISDKLIPHNELRGLLKTFMLYVKAPKFLRPLIKLCENGNDFIYKILISIFRGN